jgi:hypothetical protein
VRVLGDELPHPVDSAAQDKVQAALLREIEALGLKPHVRDTFSCRPFPARIECARVRNIVFSVGPPSGPATLAASHYDSVAAGPGASDDGIGVAAWLEIARVLSHERVTRRVIFLISDGEEPGLLGAHAFTKGDPLMASVEALVNLEARGSRGPAIFFESNQPNADAVAAFSSSPRPVANSVAAAIYALLPNSTDVTALRRPGLDVVNIALLDGFEDYHTPQDSLASFNTASLQHMGDMALSVTRKFAAAPDRDENPSNDYTDVASRVFVSAPSWAARTALALSALIAFTGFWRAGVTPDRALPRQRTAAADTDEKVLRPSWRAFAAPPLALILAGLPAAGIAFALGAFRLGEDYAFAYPQLTRAWCILLGLFGIVAALLVMRAGRKADESEAAGMFWFALIGFVASFFLSGVSALFMLPAIVYAAGCLVALAWKPAQIAAGTAAALIGLLVWGPTLHLAELALGFAFPYATAALVALMAMTWIGVLVRMRGAASWRWIASALAAGALVSAVAAAIAPNATEARPQPLNVTYFVDVSKGEARVLAGSAMRPLPRRMAQTFSFKPERILPGDRIATWSTPAQMQNASTPTLEAVATTVDGDERVVRARLRMNGAYRATLRIPRAARPMRATINGVDADFGKAPDRAEFFRLACQGRTCDGAEIAVHLDVRGLRGDWFLTGQTPGAPAQAAEVIRARPTSATPIDFGDSALTLARIRPDR